MYNNKPLLTQFNLNVPDKYNSEKKITVYDLFCSAGSSGNYQESVPTLDILFNNLNTITDKGNRDYGITDTDDAESFFVRLNHIEESIMDCLFKPSGTSIVSVDNMYAGIDNLSLSIFENCGYDYSYLPKAAIDKKIVLSIAEEFNELISKALYNPESKSALGVLNEYLKNPKAQFQTIDLGDIENPVNFSVPVLGRDELMVAPDDAPDIYHDFVEKYNASSEITGCGYKVVPWNSKTLYVRLDDEINNPLKLIVPLNPGSGESEYRHLLSVYNRFILDIREEINSRIAG